MVDGWSNMALRFAVYVDLMLLFGVPLFATYALARSDDAAWLRKRYAAATAAAAAAGTVLSVIALVAMCMEMAGASDLSGVTAHVVEMILTRTGAGFAWAVRMIALAVCLVAVASMRSGVVPRFGVISAAGAIALASLAWTGHGAMDDGARGWLHLGSDVLHLVAGGAWVGALIAFSLLSLASDDPAGRSVAILDRTASGFARVGVLVVATLLVTGVINYVLILGPTLRGLLSTAYGRLLATKLAVFAGMLALAAANRYALSPRLAAALAGGDHGQAAAMLRRSLRTETGLALVVLALVAWLGVLSPDG